MSIPAGSLVWERWQHHATTHGDDEAIVHWVAGEPPFRWRFRALFEAAQLVAAQLVERGVRQGDVCALIMRHEARFYPLYLGIVCAGAIPAVLAYPNARLHAEKFKAGLLGVAQKSGLDWILTERDLEPIVAPLVQHERSTVRGLLFPLEWSSDRLADSSPGAVPQVTRGLRTPDDPVLLQHSSGTTGLQKAVMLSHRAVLDHLEAYAESIALRPTDKIVSWLPLYHDMGLIAAFHLPLAMGIPSVQIDPFHWVLAPEILLEAISSEQCTLAWMPNFAYNFMADRVHDDELGGIRLDSMRLFVNCSEPVRAESHEKFTARFTPYGFSPNSLSACYAMAETTFAVTQTVPGVAARTVWVDRDRLAKGAVLPVAPPTDAPTRACVSSGRPIKGCMLRIVDDDGLEVPDGRVGELVISSISMFSGYRGSLDLTAEVLENGWYRSGDLGFQFENEYFIVGRKKDLIIVAGKNIYPEDIEDEVGGVEGVIPGRVIAFGENNVEAGTEQIAVIVETALETESDRMALRRRVIERGMRMSLTISAVHIVQPRWLIKSSSGKPSRRANQERLSTIGVTHAV